MHWNYLSICNIQIHLRGTRWAIITFLRSSKITRSCWLSKENTQKGIFIKLWMMMLNISSVMLGIMMTKKRIGEFLHQSQWSRRQSSVSISLCSILVKIDWDNLSINATIIINLVTQLTSINLNSVKDINFQETFMDSCLSVKWK